jgi:S-DNA-T family DNA segregation ATPase FtsK/SpoIIIE
MREMDSVTVLDLKGPRDGATARRSLQLVVDGDDVAARTAVGVERFATPDAITLAEAETTARRIGRYRPASAAHIVNLDADSKAVDPGLMAL